MFPPPIALAELALSGSDHIEIEVLALRYNGRTDGKRLAQAEWVRHCDEMIEDARSTMTIVGSGFALSLIALLTVPALSAVAASNSFRLAGVALQPPVLALASLMILTISTIVLGASLFYWRRKRSRWRKKRPDGLRVLEVLFP